MEEQDIAHILAIKSTEPLIALTKEGPQDVSAAVFAQEVRAKDWRRLSAGEGAKGPRVYAWARVWIRPLSDPDRGHWHLVRRLLNRLIWPLNADHTHVLHWSRWRRRRQLRAKYCRYERLLRRDLS